MQGVESSVVDWGLSTIPFHQLYLIELRNVTQGTWQPVIIRRVE